jgi:hypothetical protein
MGKATGFLELDRKDRSYDAPAERLKHYREFVIRTTRPRSGPGFALHELRHSLLSQRLSGEQPDPGLEPPGL